MKRQFSVKNISTQIVLAGLAFLQAALSQASDIEAVATEIAHPSKSSLSRLIERFGINGGFNTQEVGLLGLLGVQLGWRFDVEPAYREGLISRYDEFYFSAHDQDGFQVVPSALSELGIGAGFQDQVRCIFVRQYRDGWSAANDMHLLAHSYRILSYMPLDAKRAVEKMHPGDYFSIQLPMQLQFGYSGTTSLAKNLPLVKNANQYLSGQFELHIARLFNNKIQLKFVYINSRSRSIGLSSNYDGKVDIGAGSQINGAIKRLLRLSPLQFNYLGAGTTQEFMADYTLDLSDPNVAKAFDTVMEPMRSFTRIVRYSRPSLNFIKNNKEKNSENLRRSLEVSLQALDSVVQQSIQRENENDVAATATRVFKGSNLINSKNGFTIHLGTGFFGFEASYNPNSNNIKSFDIAEDPSYYTADTVLLQTRKFAGFNYWDHTESTQLTAVFSTDQNFANHKIEGVVINSDPTDKQFSPQDFIRTKNHLAVTLPPLIYKQIDFSQWSITDKYRHAVGYRSKLVLSPEFIYSLPELTPEEVAKSYALYLAKLKTEGLYRSPDVSEDDAKELAKQTEADQILNLAKNISIATTRKNDPITRLSAFIALKNNKLFLENGIRFVLELVPVYKLRNLICFDLEMNSSDGDRLKFPFCSIDSSDNFNRVVHILEIINNEGIDIKLIAQKVAYDYLFKNQTK